MFKAGDHVQRRSLGKVPTELRSHLAQCLGSFSLLLSLIKEENNSQRYDRKEENYATDYGKELHSRLSPPFLNRNQLVRIRSSICSPVPMYESISPGAGRL